MKILFCGAYGYGNVGDDIYKNIVVDNLPGHECVFDSPYPDVEAVSHVDAVVMGGGGIIYKTATSHFRYMKMYMDECLEQEKPLCFLSCGLQFQAEIDYDDSESVREVMKEWIPYFEAAKLITLRSPKCVEIVKELCPESNAHYFPDLGYAVEPSKYRLCSDDNYPLFIPRTNPLHDKAWDEMIIISTTYSRPIFVAIAAEDVDIIDMMVKERKFEDGARSRKYITPEEMASLIIHSEIVYTQRYHAMVMAHAFGIPVITFSNAYKVVNEIIPPNRMMALEAINKLKEALKV
jgi:hypothetical protein